MSSSGALNVGDLISVLRLQDDLTPAMAAAQAAAVRELGAISAAASSATKEVAALQKQWIDMADNDPGRSALESKLGEATIGAVALNKELVTAKGNIKDALEPPQGESASALDTYLTSLVTEAGAVASGMVAASAVIGVFGSAVNGVESILTGSIKAWSDQESATFRLTAALKAQGFAVPTVIGQYDALSSSYQKNTVFADEQIDAMEALLIQIGGVMPEDMDRALKASTDLAAGLGIGLEPATRLVAKAAEGNTTSLQRYGIQVNASEIATRGLSAVLDVIEEHFGGQAQAQIETYAGRVQQLGNTWNNLEESIGKFLVQNPISVLALNSVQDATQKTETDSRNLGTSWADMLEKFNMTDIALYVAAMEGLASAENQAAADAKKLAATPSPFVAFTSGMALPKIDWQSAIDDETRLANITNDLNVAQTKLTGVQKTAATEMLQHGLTVQETMTAMREYWPEIDHSKVSLEALKQSIAESSTASKAWQKVLDDVSSAGAHWQDTLQGMDATTVASALALRQQGVELSTVKAYYGLTDAQAKALDADLKFLNSTVSFASSSFNAHGVGVGLLSAHYGSLHSAITGVNDSTGLLATDTVPDATGKFVDLGDGVVSGTAALHALNAEAYNTKGAFGDLVDVIDGIPDAMARAFEGGGNLLGAFQSIVGKLGAGLGKSIVGMIPGSLGETMDTLLPGIGGAIGSLLGPLATKIGGALKGLFGGVSQDEKDARTAVDTYEKSLASTLTTTQQLEAGGRQWAATNIAVRDAYLAVGRSEADAQAAVDKLTAASHTSAAAAKQASDAIDAVMNEAKQNQADLTAATQKYGFTIEELGPAMRAQQLTQQAVGLENDFQMLVGSGIDVKTVVDRMSGALNDYLHLAMKTGSEVPAEMQPIIEKMIEQGDLTDANGNKITNMADAGFTFSETMTQGFQKIVDKLTDVVNAIAKTTGALNGIPTKKDIDIVTHFSSDGTDPSASNIRAATGGFVTSTGILYAAGGFPGGPSGTDTIPAWLTPGEAVLNTRATASLGANTISALNHGATTSGGADMLAAFTAMQNELRGLRADMNTRIPQTISAAVRDAQAAPRGRR